MCASAFNVKASVPNKYGVKVGDIFVSSWGYDQTNVDCYQVIRTTAAMVTVVKVGWEIVGNRVRPVKNAWLADGSYVENLNSDPDEYGRRDNARDEYGSLIRTFVAENRKLQKPEWADAPFFNVSSYSTARLWDGERTFHETYAAGGMGH